MRRWRFPLLDGVQTEPGWVKAKVETPILLQCMPPSLPYRTPKYSNVPANPTVRPLRPVKLGWTRLQQEGLSGLLSALDCANMGQVVFDASSGESMRGDDVVECTNWSSKGSSETFTASFLLCDRCLSTCCVTALLFL